MSLTCAASRFPAANVERWKKRDAQRGFTCGKAPDVWPRDRGHDWRPWQRIGCMDDRGERNSAWLVQQGLRMEDWDLWPVAVPGASALAACPGLPPDASEPSALAGEEAEADEGAEHRGRSALIDQVARKR